MRRSRDITTDKLWIAEQVDRFLGFEVLKAVATADPEPVPPHLLADKLGLNKGFSYLMMENISRRLNQ